jgi:LysR family transcriptional regulator (chromosome initiation inhibitor)
VSAFDLDHLEALAAAVAEGTFDAAARELHVTPSAISQRIKSLETAVGRVLVTRSKPVRPTPSGEILLRAARQIDAIADDAARELGHHQPDTPSRVGLAVNADSLATWFIPALAPLADSLLFDIRREDETRTSELLREGSVMAAVSASAQPIAGCSVERLGRMRYRPRASKEFSDRWFADGATIAELERAPMVVFDRSDETQDRYLRRRTRRRLDPPRHYVPGSETFLEAISRGLGWGMIPDLQMTHPHAAGLVEMDDTTTIDVALHWLQWRLRSPALQSVADAVRAQAASMLR